MVVLLAVALACESAADCVSAALEAERVAAWASHQRVLGKGWPEEEEALQRRAKEARLHACWAGDAASCTCLIAEYGAGATARERACFMGAEEQCALLPNEETRKRWAEAPDGWRREARDCEGNPIEIPEPLGPKDSWTVVYDEPWRVLLLQRKCEVRLPADTAESREIAALLHPHRWPVDGEVRVWSPLGREKTAAIDRRWVGYRVIGSGVPFVQERKTAGKLYPHDLIEEKLLALGDATLGAWLVVPGPGEVPEVAADAVARLGSDIPYHAIPYVHPSREMLATWRPFPVEVVFADGERLKLGMPGCPLEGSLCRTEGPADAQPTSWPDSPDLAGTWALASSAERVSAGPDLADLTPEERWELLEPLSPSERAVVWAGRVRSSLPGRELPPEACPVALPDGSVWWNGSVWAR